MQNIRKHIDMKKQAAHSAACFIRWLSQDDSASLRIVPYIFLVAGLLAGAAVFAFLMFLLTAALLLAGALGAAALLLSERICGATLTVCSVVQPPITVLHVANAWPEKMVSAVKIILNFNLNLHKVECGKTVGVTANVVSEFMQVACCF